MPYIPYSRPGTHAGSLAYLTRQKLACEERLGRLVALIQQMPDYDKCWCPELDVKRAAIEDGFCPGCQARAQVAEITGETP